MDKILSLDATGQLAALQAKRISAAELLEASLRRCDEVDGPINAVVVKDAGRRLRRRRTIDRPRARAVRRGPARPLPMAIKGPFDVVGMPASSGHEAFRRRKRPDSVVASHVRQA